MSVLADLRFGFRTLRKTPAVAAVAIISLALGIGGNTAVFSLADAVFLKLLPVHDPQELVVFGSGDAMGVSFDDPPGTELFSLPYAREFEALGDVFSGVATVCTFDVNTSIREGESTGDLERGSMRLVSGNYFSVIGVAPFHGRLIRPSDDRAPGASPVVVLSHAYWQRRFGADASVIGRPLVLNRATYTIVGVTPPEFFGESAGRGPDGYVPLSMQPELMRRRSLLENRKIAWLTVIARLRPGVPIERAETAANLRFQQVILANAGADISAERRKAYEQVHISLTPGSRGLALLRNSLRQPLFTLLAVVIAVLLIACANIATLLIARAAARRGEIGVRLALGSGRARLVRQLLTEGLLLAVPGALGGLLVAAWIRPLLLSAVSSGSAPVHLDLPLDWRVFGFTAGVALLTSLLFGLAPALQAARLNLVPALQSGARGGSHANARFGLKRALVITQVGLSLWLLIGAGLFLRTLEKLRAVDIGVDTENVVVASVNARAADYDAVRQRALNQEIIDRLRALPGVRNAAFSLTKVLEGSYNSNKVVVEGYMLAQGDGEEIIYQFVTDEYFDTLGIPLLQGRGYAANEHSTALVVNQAFANRFFRDRPALGATVRTFEAGQPRARTIVGIVGNVRQLNLRSAGPVIAYLPADSGNEMILPGTLQIRTSQPASAIGAELRGIVREIDPNVPVGDVTTMQAQVDRGVRYETLLTRLTGFFSIFALFLAAVGIFGVMSYVVAQRTREIGIRKALGAERSGVLWLIMRDSLLLVGAGTAAGLVVAYGAGRYLASLLYGVGAFDPLTVAGAVAVLASASAGAAYFPARWAARIDPIRALRQE